MHRSIFISSTFQDMHYERDAIHTRIIPAINQEAGMWGDSVSACDLRWGINTADMEDIDKSHYKGGQLIESDVLGPIPPERLSGGLQTLICIYKRPDLMYNATSCGENCAKWLLEIGRRIDVSVNLRYYMPFDNCGDFMVRIINEDKIIDSIDDYMHIALKYV